MSDFSVLSDKICLVSPEARNPSFPFFFFYPVQIFVSQKGQFLQSCTVSGIRQPQVRILSQHSDFIYFVLKKRLFLDKVWKGNGIEAKGHLSALTPILQREKFCQRSQFAAPKCLECYTVSYQVLGDMQQINGLSDPQCW